MDIVFLEINQEAYLVKYPHYETRDHFMTPWLWEQTTHRNKEFIIGLNIRHLVTWNKLVLIDHILKHVVQNVESTVNIVPPYPDTCAHKARQTPPTWAYTWSLSTDQVVSRYTGIAGNTGSIIQCRQAWTSPVNWQIWIV